MACVRKLQRALDASGIAAVPGRVNPSTVNAVKRYQGRLGGEAVRARAKIPKVSRQLSRESPATDPARTSQ